MIRLRYIILILLLMVTGRLAGQEPVIDQVCYGSSYHYRVDGETGSTYTWELTHPDGTIDMLVSTADTILIHWNYTPGTYMLEVMQYNEDYECEAVPMAGYIIIHDLPLVSLDSFDDLCLDAGPLTLAGGLPAGGVYSGTGVSGGIFDPALAGPGTHPITYTFTDSNGCVNFAEATIHVFDLPLVSLDPFDDLCLDAEPLTLSGGLPAGGTYTGTGITAGVFDPVLAGSGQHTVTYTFTDSNGCVNFAIETITVHDMPVVSLSDFGNYCISMSPFNLIGGLPAGGTYTGPGVSGNTFDPTLAGSGIHTISYTFTDANGCTSTTSASITVYDLPLVTLDDFESLCLDATPITLTGGLPAGGVYSGPGVSGDTFDPALAGSGNHTITYTFTDGNGCGGFATAQITVHETPTVSLAAFDEICIDVSPFALTGGLPEGGTYTGTGVSEGTFNPATAGAGDHLITYTYNDANGCANFATATITVHELPVVSLADFDGLCIDAAPVTLVGGLPAGGTYTGPGISGDTFDPSLAGNGVHTITYTYTDINGCTSFAQATISVSDVPSVSLAEFDDLCLDAAPLVLTGGLPEGGTYTGTGVSAGIFDPAAAGPGTHIITYTYADANGCENSATTEITVHELPIVTLDDFDNICLDAAPFELTRGMPTGGTYSGTGVSGNTFSPAAAGAGDHLITYTYTDANGCTEFATTTLTVNDMPLVSLDPFDDICLDAGLITLSGGMPAGGTYSGTGITANIFDPMAAGLGSHEITYTYTDAFGCTVFATATIEVIELPVVTLSNIEGICADGVAFALSGGLPEGGIYNGPGITGGTFDPATAGPGVHTFTYTYTDASGCAGTAMATIRVEETPVLTLDDLDDVCIDAAPFALSGGQPEGGTYSGPEITAGVFDPMVAGLGMHQFTYTYTDSNGCTAIGTASIHVVNTPTVLLALDIDVCTDTAPFTLSGGLPLGGTYSGEGVVGDVFDPELAGTGEHIITYTYTDASGCTGFATAPIRVNPLTPATLEPFDDICIDIAPFAITGGLPAGGVYTGAGITGNIFDPAAAGAGDHLITYTYTDAFGCTAFDTATIRVMELPVVSLEAIDAVCIDVAPFALTGGLPTGGTYSGTGVTAGAFDPETAGPGNHLITYTYTDANGCTGFATVTLEVIDIPVVSLTLVSDVCRDTAPFALTGGMPLGGFYTGDGVSGGIFDPDLAGPGGHLITYTYTDANGCTAFATATITVNPVEPATLEPFTDICLDAAPFALTGGLPAGGVYTGTGVNGNTFDPAAAGAGEHIITYTYTDAFGCTAFTTATITVMPLPTVSLGTFDDLCIDAAAFALTGGLPAGGTYSGAGVTAGMFDPEVARAGLHLISYTYTDANGCTAIATTEIRVVDVPNVTLANISDMCIDAGTFALTGGLPAGGTYTGIGVSGYTFDPAIAGPGVHLITYTVVSAAGCEGFAVASFTVFDLPAVSLTFTEDVCADASAFALSGGLPAGGTYSGTGVTANFFDPSVTGAGDHVITYTYTDINGCLGTATATIHVNELPVVTLADLSDVCVDTAPFALGGGLPAGGVYSGPGVTAGTFDPAAAGNGTHLITYTYTDANGCAASATAEIHIANMPNVTLADMDNVCIDATPFILTGGLPAGGTYSGTGITANIFDPLAAGLGVHTVTYTYTDASGCTGFATASLRVVNAPVVTLANQGSVCDNEASFVLSGGLPTGGTYSGTGVTNGMFDPATAGPGNHLITYFYTDANGCFREATATITVHPVPVASLPGFGTICIDATPFFLSGGLPAGGTYSGEGVTPAGLFVPHQAGEGLHTIYYTLTDANGCTAVATAEIVVAPMPVVACGGDIEVAEDDGLLTLSGGLPADGIYSGTGITNGIFDPAVAGVGDHIITYTYTDANGCASFCTFTITVTMPIPDLEAFAQVDNQVSCFGAADGRATAWATGGVLSYTYQWNDPAAQTTAQATGLVPGIYTVVITDADGRTDQATVTITQPTALTLAVIGANPTTPGGNQGSATATAGGGTPGTLPYTYLWNDSNAQTTATATDLVAGTYTVIVTDANGCTIIGQITLRDPLGGTAIVLNPVSCFGGNDGRAEARPLGGVPPYTYQWSNGQTSKIATNLAAGTYTVTIRDSLGNASVATVIITQPTALNILSVTVIQPSVPGGNDGMAQAVVNGGTAPYQYFWTGNGITRFGPIAIGLVAGTYTLRVTDFNGCVVTRTVILTDPILPLVITARVIQDVTCFGGSDGIAEASATGGVGPYRWRWTPTNQSTARATGLSARTYTVTVFDSRNVTASTQITIGQPTEIVLGITGTNPIIPGVRNGSATVTATGGTPGTPPYTYLWNDPAAQTTQTATGLGAGTHWVTVTDANGCSKQISVDLVDPRANISIAKLANVTSVDPGGTIIYNLNITNAGPATAFNLLIEDILPANVAFVSASSGGVFNAANNTITWNIPQVDVGQLIRLIVTVTANQGLPGGMILRNTARMTSPYTDNPLEAYFNVRVNNVPDMVVVKTALQETYSTVGEFINYTITVTNTGNVALTNIVVTDPDAIITGGSPITNLAIGASAVVTARHTVTQNDINRGFFENIASATARDNAGTVITRPSNKEIVNAVHIPALTIVKAAIEESFAVVGDTINYTFTITNTGNVILHDITVSDPGVDLYAGGSVALLNPGESIEVQGRYIVTQQDLINGQYANIAGAEGLAPSGETAAAVSNEVIVPAVYNDIVANDDISDREIGGHLGGVSVDNVLVNDLLNGLPVSLAQVILRQTADLTAAGITLDENTGAVSIAPGTPGGTYQISYEICEVLNIANCDDAVVTVFVGFTADLAINKQTLTSPVIPGEIVTYTVEVTNLGPEDAKEVVVTDLFSNDFSDPEYSTDGGATWQPWTGRFAYIANNGIFRPGQRFSLMLRALLQDNVTGQVSNTAVVASPTDDPFMDNNTSTATDTAVPHADLALAKTAAPDPVTAGEYITYTLTVTNNGPSVASAITITDLLSGDFSGADYSTNNGVSWQTWSGSYLYNEGDGTLVPSQSFSIMIRARTSSHVKGTVVNTASVSAGTHDPDISNNTASVTTGIITRADLAIVKTASPVPVIAGEFVTYSLAITNLGPSDAEGILVEDDTHEWLSQVEYSTDSGQTWQAWTVSHTLASPNDIIPAGDTFVLNIRARLHPGATGNLPNTASVSAATPDPNLANNTSAIQTPIGTRADLAMTKTALQDTIFAGESVSYRLTITNNGPSNARLVKVEDIPVSALSNVRYSLDNGTSWSTWNGTLTYGPAAGGLPAGDSFDILITGIVDGAYVGDLPNTASVSSGTSDPDLSNNTDTEIIFVETKADMAITKTAMPNPAVAGDTLRFVIEVTNLGPSGAHGVVIEDITGPEFNQVTYSTSRNSLWASWTGSFDFEAAHGVFMPGETFTIILSTTINSDFTGTVSNTATVGADTFDPDLSNNTATVVTDVIALADLSITKTADPVTVTAGESVTYTLYITNHGPSDALNITVTDIPGEELSNREFSNDQGATWNDWDGSYLYKTDGGRLKPGSSFSILIRGDLSQEHTGSLINTATVESTTPDPELANNTATIASPVLTLADLAISMTDNTDGLGAQAGGQLTYTITITNLGPSAAQNPTVVSHLPAEVIFVSAENGGVYNPLAHSVSWTLNTMLADSTVTFDLVTTIKAATPEGTLLTNNALVNSTTGDPDLDNNIATVVTPVSTQADLSIVYQSIVPTRSPTAGTQIAYTIRVHNAGPSDALESAVYTEIPQNLDYVRSNMGNTINQKSLVWSLGLIPAGATLDITLVVNVPSYVFENTIISSEVEVNSETFDPILENNVDSADIDIRAQADLSIVKSIEDDVQNVVGGDLLTYTIAVTNNGPSFAYDLRITDELPPGLSFVSADDNGYYDDYYRTVTWTLPFLANGHTVYRHVVVRVDRETSRGTILRNNAYTISATHDPNATNNFWSVEVTAEAPGELFIPEGFSPDGDGINDYFVIGGLEDLYPENKILIIDRWGKKLHEASPYQNDWWDGTDLDCTPLPIGTYYYILELSGGKTIRGFIYIMLPY